MSRAGAEKRRGDAACGERGGRSIMGRLPYAVSSWVWETWGRPQRGQVDMAAPGIGYSDLYLRQLIKMGWVGLVGSR